MLRDSRAPRVQSCQSTTELGMAAVDVEISRKAQIRKEIVAGLITEAQKNPAVRFDIK